MGFAGNRAKGCIPIEVAEQDMWKWKGVSSAIDVIKITAFGGKGGKQWKDVQDREQ